MLLDQLPSKVDSRAIGKVPVVYIGKEKLVFIYTYTRHTPNV